MSRGGGCNIEGERGLGGEGRSGQWLINYLKQHYWCYEDILHPSARKHYSSHLKKRIHGSEGEDSERDEGERLLYIHTSSTYNKDDICSCS